MIAAESSIRTLYPLSATSSNEWSELFANGFEQHYKRGQLIFSENRHHPFVYQVVKGLVAVSSSRRHHGVILDAPGRGDLVNLEALMQSMLPVSATALSGATIVKRLPVSELKQALQANPGWYERIQQQLMGHIQRSQQRIHDLMVLSASERIVHFLLQYVFSQGRPVGLEWVVQPVLTHHEIGLLTGTGRQTVTTVLNELRNEGVVHFTRHYFIIRDVDRMRALCGCED